MHPFPGNLAFSSFALQEAYQLDALQRLLRYVTKRSPFYQEKLRSLSPPSINSLEDLRLLPFTGKEDIQQQNWEFLCTPRSAIREYMTTSGTMGKPVTLALTENDLQRLAYNESQSFQIADGSSEDVYQLALTLDRQFMAGMAYYSGIRRMGASLVRCGPGLPAMQWETIQRLGSTTLVAVPSFLMAMANWAIEQGIDLSKSSLKRAICIGESLRRNDFSLNTLGKQLQARWPLKLYSTYASTEIQTAFTECSAGRGGHHHPELCIVEIIGANGEPVPDGASGEVVVTPLGIEGMPLLRYRTGDVAALHAETCSCGRLSKRLGPVLGRKGQMIKFKGTTLFPTTVYEVLNDVPFVQAYLLEAYSNEQGLDELRLHLQASVQESGQEESLRDLLRSKLRVAPALSFHPAGILQEMISPEGARKAIRFLDRRLA
ncbi:MAG: AMP-binding protein [Bacteroidetes bacterium]|nr:AMP-binding protein [Bacteroidota bacterium]